MTQRAIARIVDATGRSEAEGEDALVRQGRLGRLLEPEEVADTIVFLASPAAQSINGQALVIDGGAVQALVTSVSLGPCSGRPSGARWRWREC
jgi:NAD(P)-dependent dehydrogenase (short-subunit alcohol dehydrogenase family)